MDIYVSIQPLQLKGEKDPNKPLEIIGEDTEVVRKEQFFDF